MYSDIGSIHYNWCMHHAHGHNLYIRLGIYAHTIYAVTIRVACILSNT